MDDEIDLALFGHALRARWPIIAALALTGGALALLAVLWAQPLFEVNGSLYLGDTHQKAGLAAGGSISALFGGAFGSSGVQTQVEVLRSRDLVTSAIEYSGLNARIWPGQQTTPPTIRFWSWRLLDGKRLRVWKQAAGGLNVRDAAVINRALERVPLAVRFDEGGRYRVLKSGQTLLQGQLGQPAVGEGLRLDLYTSQTGFTPPSGAYYRLRIERPVHAYERLATSGRYQVQTASAAGGSQPTRVVRLSFKDADPYRARRFLQALMRAYLTQNLRWSTEQAGTEYRYLDGQIRKIRKALSTADQRLADYKKQSGMVAVTDDARAMIGELAHYQMQRSAAQLKLHALRQISASLKAPHGTVDPYLVSSVDDPLLNGMTTRLTAAQTDLGVLSEEYTRSAPQVLVERARIARLRAGIRTLIDNQTQLAHQQLANMDGLIAGFNAKLGQLPAAELKIVALARSSEVLGKLYMFLLQKQQQAALSKAGAVTSDRVLDHPETNAMPIQPKPRLVLTMGLFLGLFAGISYVIAQILLAPGYRSEDELRSAYPDLDWYGLLPHFRKQRGQSPCFTPQDARADYGEAIRTLRSNMYLSQRAGADQVWMVTSPLPGDGKSTIAYELACALAADGKRVLLIDGDIRKPQAHDQLRVIQTPGLSDVLAGRAQISDAIHTAPERGFDLLPGGRTPPNPAELMGSDVWGPLLAEVRTTYAFVLLDTPPFPRVGDARMLARYADRILTVLRLGSTARKAFQAHLQGLGDIGTPLGLVVNDLNGAQGGYGYGYGYGYGEPPAGSRWAQWKRRWWKHS